MPASPKRPCPFLPASRRSLSWRLLAAHGNRRDEAFYADALEYGQWLWIRGCAGRALLALTRALYADVPPNAPVLQEWPLPYAAIRWIVEAHGSDHFPGNPRISFQHQACRLRGPREPLRKARAWAAWSIVRAARPSLSGDRSAPLEEPGLEQIAGRLDRFGHPDESRLWQRVLAGHSPFAMGDAALPQRALAEPAPSTSRSCPP